MEQKKGNTCPFTLSFHKETRKLQGFDCIQDSCMMWVEGDCSLKGMFHSKYQNAIKVVESSMEAWKKLQAGGDN